MKQRTLTVLSATVESLNHLRGESDPTAAQAASRCGLRLDGDRWVPQLNKPVSILVKQDGNKKGVFTLFHRDGTDGNTLTVDNGTVFDLEEKNGGKIEVSGTDEQHCTWEFTCTESQEPSGNGHIKTKVNNMKPDTTEDPPPPNDSDNNSTKDKKGEEKKMVLAERIFSSLTELTRSMNKTEAVKRLAKEEGMSVGTLYQLIAVASDLSPVLRPEFNKGILPLQSAYKLTTLPKGDQEAIWRQAEQKNSRTKQFAKLLELLGTRGPDPDCPPKQEKEPKKRKYRRTPSAKAAEVAKPAQWKVRKKAKSRIKGNSDAGKIFSDLEMVLSEIEELTTKITPEVVDVMVHTHTADEMMRVVRGSLAASEMFLIVTQSATKSFEDLCRQLTSR